MFYSHEVLTNRKYGVATVWLVATLGAKSSLKRITRKQMLDVDVAKACKVIVDPVTPMALRLQGNLLYGVSRVYLQQCGYVLADAQNAHNTMMLMLRSVQNYGLDPDAGKARPEQLILEDDPSFLPEFALPPPELLGQDLNLDFPHSGDSQSLTPFGSRQSSQSSHVGGYGLVLPSSTPDQPAGGGLQGDQDNNAIRDIDNLLQLDDPEFEFGEDGDIVEFTPGSRAPAAPVTPVASRGPAVHSDADASARVRQDHEEGRQRGEQGSIGDAMDLDLPVYGDDLPDVETTPPTNGHQLHEPSDAIESLSSAVAPMRRKKRAAKVILRDTKLELRNSELLSWQTDYLENMKEAAESNVQKHIKQQAKKNAEHYVWGAGIGGLGQDPFGAHGPLNQFIGDNLYEMITGKSKKSKSTLKRDRDSGIDEATQEEARGKRQRTVEREGELGRGGDDEGLFMLGGDEEVELPREAVSALDDQQIFSAMPWNISASKRGSSAVPLSGRVTMMSDQAKQGSHRGSRMVSASPLLRRSTGRAGDFEALQGLDSDALGGDEFAYAAPTSDPVGPEEEAMQPSLRVREALSAEGENFFTFVAEAITGKRERVLADRAAMSDMDQDDDTELETITFEELLLPPETSKMIACQGFLMLLSLGTKGMLDVEQHNAFDYITLELTEKAKAMQIIEAEDGNEKDQTGDEEVMRTPVKENTGKGDDSATEAGDDAGLPELDNSHFQEQMAAGHATAGNDDNDEHDSFHGSE